MTHAASYFRARAERARQRMGLVPLYSPAAATRDAVAGDSTPDKERSAGYPTGHGVRQGLADAVAAQLPPQTSSAVAGTPEPSGTRLGSKAALDTFPRSSLPGVPGLPASKAVAVCGSESRLVFPSKRMKWIDDLLDDLAWVAGWGVLGLVAFVVAVRVFGGAS